MLEEVAFLVPNKFTFGVSHEVVCAGLPINCISNVISLDEVERLCTSTAIKLLPFVKSELAKVAVKIVEPSSLQVDDAFVL